MRHRYGIGDFFHRRLGLRQWCELVFIALIGGCASHTNIVDPHPPLTEYTRYNDSERLNLPESYIAFLRKTRFTHGEFDHLPQFAIVFHGDPSKYFSRIGVGEADWTTLELGTTDPSLLYVVRPKGHAPFMINRGLPGAGGASTQTAELLALGARYVVHIGTSALLGPERNETQVLVSDGAYRDGGAVMLSQGGKSAERLSYPDRRFSEQIRDALLRFKVASDTAAGYTIPLYYFQSAGLIRALLTDAAFAQPRPGYLEMEEATFFETAKRAKVKAASLTVGADRYVLERGELKHYFLNDDDVRQSLARAILATEDAFNAIDRSEHIGGPGSIE